MNKYTPVIGLETHVELKTSSKMFCGCAANYFGKQPNSQTCPVCLGLPGALPVPNKKAIDWCIKISLSLNCKINMFSKFDRKNYFYPDLSKGYQISQYDLPFGHNGHITLSNGNRIRIRRVHMEEDTGKLIHDGEISLIDFNRSGVPLVEIVTEPDFHDAKDVKEYLQKLRQAVRYLDVADADMEKGDMRLEPNISLRDKQQETSNILPNYKVEVKNINSFKFVEKAVNYEIKRQTEILDKNEVPPQETRGWDEIQQKTFSQRSKEDAMDYRYFPEPDIPPITFTDTQIAELKSQIPELPDAKRKRFEAEYKLTEYDAEILTREKNLADYFENTVKVGQDYKINPKQIANTIINKKPNIENILPATLVKIIVKAGQTDAMDEKKLQKVVKEVLTQNTKAVEEYLGGKENALMFLLGQAMKKLGKVDASQVKQLLVKMIK